ncbi:MAG: spore maturation protein [candidate division KSB1 bacterium]|nr:spore maturation protein [candidate division KSB1 bacterium]
MLNYIWLGLMAIALLVGGTTGKITEVTKAAFSSSGTAVEIALGLVGVMALWLGIMRIAEEAGMVRALAYLVRPIARRLFPDVPPEHPAMGAMVLNIAANWLGLGNAATPLGLKAMEELQKLNPEKDTATNAMVMFLALNTASITLIPATVIAVRAQLGSSDPAEIIGTTIFSSTCATLAAVTATKLLEYAQLAARERWARFLGLGKALGIFALGVALIAVLRMLGILSALFGWLTPELFRKAISAISDWAIPVLLFAIPVSAAVRRVKVYEAFVEGAKEGFQIAVRIIPFLVAILVAIAMFRSSGAMDLFVRLVSPLTDLIGMPAEVLPAALMRPLSGSGTLGIITELMKTHGPDSFIGRLASTIYGCTETTFYVIAVYFGSVQIKKTRHAVPAGLIGDCAGILAALFICKLVFGE